MTDKRKPTTGQRLEAEKFTRLWHYQRALAGFSRVTTEPLAPQRLMHHACVQIAAVTGIDHVKVLRYRADCGDLLIEEGVGWKPGVVGHTTQPIDLASPPGRSLQTGAPVVIEDLPHDPEFRNLAVLRDHGIVSLVNVPVMIDSKSWGVLEVDADKPRTFDEVDITFLTTFANLLGSALRCCQVLEAASRAAQQHAQAEALWETVVRELTHRVKNNFQIIVSFLALQRRRAKSQDSKDLFATVMERVRAIALAHDQLSISNQESSVEFGDYLRALCRNIEPGRGEVLLEVEASEATLPLDRAVPAGLIVNELVTNAYKYAFDENGGVIRVQFDVNPARGEACLAVEDNGKGMGSPREGGLGLQLVEALAEQLQGRLEHRHPSRGTRTLVCFPLAL